MSYKTDYKIEGFFEYDVPPLGGFWWHTGVQDRMLSAYEGVSPQDLRRQDDVTGVDYTNKDNFNWISVIRLPDFVTEKDFAWAVKTATKKKKLDCSMAEFLTIEEGLCVQIMHHGSYDSEPETVALMDAYLAETDM